MNQAKVLKERLSKIQIQTIKLISIVDNQTGLYPEYSYCLNVLCELTTVKFMKKAIDERIFEVNKIEILEIDYEQIFNCDFEMDLKT